MLTYQTRTIGGVDKYDRQSVRIDGSAYAGKSGLLKLTIQSYSVFTTGGNLGGAVIKMPNFKLKNDNIGGPTQGGNITLNSTGTFTVNWEAFIAVNNGVPGPSVRVNQDGTWDVLDFSVSLPDGNTQTNVTVLVNAEVDYTDLTPSTSNPSAGTVIGELDTTPTSPEDTAELGVPASTFGSSGGYVKAWFNQIFTEAPIGGVPVSILDSTGIIGDFSVVKAGVVAAGGCGCHGGGEVPDAAVMMRHALAPTWGMKVYSQGQFIFAVNGGKIDANGINQKGNNAQLTAFKVKLRSANNIRLIYQSNVSGVVVS